MEEDHDVMFFQKWLGRYCLEHIQAKNCPTEKDLGLILIDSQELKEQLLPSPLRCLEALHEIMPQKAKTMMDRLIQLSQDAVIKLEGDPTSTIDYVNLLRFMDEIQEKMVGMEEEASVVKDLYDLMEKYQSPEDHAVYQMEQLQEKTFTYRSYQKTFKVEVTRFEELEETHAEVKLKQTLWEAQREWSSDYDKWMTANFDELQPEVVNGQVLKYAKSVYQLEKGLPPNGVVPVLKAKAEEMKDKVNISTIAGSQHMGPIKSRVDELNLFSETLDEWMVCQRNWLYIESVFGAPDIQHQLPNEAKMFSQVDKSWKEIMRRVHKNPICIHVGTQPGLLETFKQNNELLDQIQKCLEDYLESKRLVFPCFFFLSNDELLKILSQTCNPQAVQPHLRKLEFGTTPSSEPGAPPIVTNDLLAMISPEREKVSLQKLVKARGNAENWLGLVEESMMISLNKLTKAAIVDFETKPRHKWATQHPSQNLNKLAELVRGELPKLICNIIGALITIDVHARDIVTQIVHNKVQGLHDF